MAVVHKSAAPRASWAEAEMEGEGASELEKTCTLAES